MSEGFDPYYQWLGIRKENQPADHYRLLGLTPFEENSNVIQAAADRQMAYIRTYALGAHANISQRILNELAGAKLCLLDPARKAAYDKRLAVATEAATREHGSHVLDKPHVRPVPEKTTVNTARPPRKPLQTAVPPPIPSNPHAASNCSVIDEQEEKRLANLFQETRKDIDTLIAKRSGIRKQPSAKSQELQRHASKAGSHYSRHPQPIRPVTKRRLAIVAGIAAGFICAGLLTMVLTGRDSSQRPTKAVSVPVSAPFDAVVHLDWKPCDLPGVAEIEELRINGKIITAAQDGPMRVACQGPNVRVVAKRKNCVTFAKQLAIEPGEVRSIRIAWTANSMLSLFLPTYERESLRVTIDGTYAPLHEIAYEITPWEIHIALEPGDHLLQLERSGYESVEKQFSLPQRGREQFDVVWKPQLQEQRTAANPMDPPVPVDDTAPVPARLNVAGKTAEVSIAAEPEAGEVKLASTSISTSSINDAPVTVNVTPTAGNKANTARQGLGDLLTIDTRSPVPSPDSLEAAVERLREVFKADFDKAKTFADNHALAEKLLAVADESSTHLAGKFACWKTAADVASEVGDGQIAFRGINALARVFQVDAVQMKAAVLSQGLKRARFPTHHRALAQVALAVSDDAIAGDNLGLARELADLAFSAARKANDSELLQRALMRTEEVTEIVATFEETQTAYSTLEQDPHDSDANLVVGQYLCFMKGDWERGLPRLARGSDSELAEAAAEELKPAASAEELVKRADRWWELAAKQQGPAIRQTQLYAADLYDKAEPHIFSGELEKARQRKETAGWAAVSRTCLLPATDFLIDSPGARRITYPIRVPKLKALWGVIEFAVKDMHDDGGDGGMHVAICDKSGREVLRQFGKSKEAAWFYSPSVIGDSDWIVVLEDRDVRSAGNSGTIEIWINPVKQ